MTEISGRQVGINDLGVMAAGAAALVFSLLPYYGFSYDLAGASFDGSFTAWHSYAVIGMLMLIAAAGVVAARVFGDVELPKLPVGWYVVGAGLATLGTVLVILRALNYPHGDVPGGSYGIRWGGYLLFLAAIAETVFAIRAWRESGEPVTFDRGPAGGTPDAAPPAAT
jgi:hypothetical protein